MSARRSGGPSISAWSRKPSTNDRKAARLVTGTSNTTDAVGPSPVDRVRAERGIGPVGLLGVDQQLGDHLLLVAETPRRRRVGAEPRRPGERTRGALDRQRPSHPVQAEQPLLPAGVVQAGQVPVAAAERQPPGVDHPVLAPVGEPDPAAVGDRREQPRPRRPRRAGRPGRGRAGCPAAGRPRRASSRSRPRRACAGPGWRLAGPTPLRPGPRTPPGGGRPARPRRGRGRAARTAPAGCGSRRPRGGRDRALRSRAGSPSGGAAPCPARSSGGRRRGRRSTPRSARGSAPGSEGGRCRSGPPPG